MTGASYNTPVARLWASPSAQPLSRFGHGENVSMKWINPNSEATRND